MPQARNSNRNASLDQKKTRAAGRQSTPRSPKGDLPLASTSGRTKKVGGASGKGERVRSRNKGSALTKGGGGGGAAFSIPKD